MTITFDDRGNSKRWGLILPPPFERREIWGWETLHQVHRPTESKDTRTLNQQIHPYLALSLKGSYCSLFPKSNQSTNLLCFSSMWISFPSNLSPAGGAGPPEVVSLKEETGSLIRLAGEGERPVFKLYLQGKRAALFIHSLDQDCVFIPEAQKETFIASLLPCHLLPLCGLAHLPCCLGSYTTLWVPILSLFFLPKILWLSLPLNPNAWSLEELTQGLF